MRYFISLWNIITINRKGKFELFIAYFIRNPHMVYTNIVLN